MKGQPFMIQDYVLAKHNDFYQALAKSVWFGFILGGHPTHQMLQSGSLGFDSEQALAAPAQKYSK
jgi:hypothetical protein